MLAGSLFLIVLTFILFPETIQKYQLNKTDNFVTVTIVELPDCTIGYKNKFLTINYNGVNHILRTKCKYVRNLQTGTNIKMLHKDDSNIFLFKEEDVTFDLISLIILCLAGILSLIISFRRNINRR